MAKFSRDFFLQDTLQVARGLLGAELRTCVKGRITSGVIVEVEAYHQDGDLAAHSCRAPTERTRIMFENGGYCYVYFIYGNHFCVNVVTEAQGVGAAVLIRAVEPLKGLELMRRRRPKAANDIGLTNGPGKLCQALGIDKRMNEEDLLSSMLISLRPCRSIAASDVVRTSRVGISKSQHLPWRFYVKGSRWVSKP